MWAGPARGMPGPARARREASVSQIPRARSRRSSAAFAASRGPSPGLDALRSPGRPGSPAPSQAASSRQ